MCTGWNRPRHRHVGSLDYLLFPFFSHKTWVRHKPRIGFRGDVINLSCRGRCTRWWWRVASAYIILYRVTVARTITNNAIILYRYVRDIEKYPRVKARTQISFPPILKTYNHACIRCMFTRLKSFPTRIDEEIRNN